MTQSASIVLAVAILLLICMILKLASWFLVLLLVNCLSICDSCFPHCMHVHVFCKGSTYVRGLCGQSVDTCVSPLIRNGNWKVGFQKWEQMGSTMGRKLEVDIVRKQREMRQH
jgi:hypothetical protein